MLRWPLMLMVLVACGGEDEESPCGDVLTCGSGEFCLVVFPEGSDYGDQQYACKALPAGCDDFDAMCNDDPPCGTDWAQTYCPADVRTVGCSAFGGVEEAVCEL